MIKELTIAIVFGALVGFGITTGLVNIKNKNPNSTKQTIIEETVSDSSHISQDNLSPTLIDHNLIITYPTPDAVLNQSKLTIKGQTSSNSTLIIHTSIDTFFPEIDDTGLFQQEIELEAGANLIQVSSLSISEQQIDKEILVTFTTAEF